MFDKHWERFLLGVKTCGHVKCIKFWSQIGTKTSSPSAWDHWTQFMFYFAGFCRYSFMLAACNGAGTSPAPIFFESGHEGYEL